MAKADDIREHLEACATGGETKDIYMVSDDEEPGVSHLVVAANMAADALLTGNEANIDALPQGGRDKLVEARVILKKLEPRDIAVVLEVACGLTTHMLRGVSPKAQAVPIDPEAKYGKMN